MKKAMIIAAIIGLFSPMIVCAADADVTAYNVHIRSLAASCAACHGTQGNAVSTGADSTLVLAGTSKNDIITKLQAFKSGEKSSTVMHHHAKGLSADEITALAEYFSLQKSGSAPVLKSQKLRDDHAN